MKISEYQELDEALYELYIKILSLNSNKLILFHLNRESPGPGPRCWDDQECTAIKFCVIKRVKVAQAAGRTGSFYMCLLLQH